MAYHIKRTTSNAYRCGCCQRTWDSDEWIEDRALALSKVPTTHDRDGKNDYELMEVEVIDGSTGQVIAYGKLDFYGKRGTSASQYHNQVWRGHIDGVDFEEVKTDVKGETWTDALVRINKEIEESHLAKAKAELEAAQKRFDALTKK